MLKPSRTSPAWRVAITIICLYVAGTLALIPIADRAGPVIPAIVPLFVAGILVTSLSTGFLLLVQFGEAHRRSLLLLACAYLYAGLMAVPHLLTFPDAVVADRSLIGTSASTAWVFVAWVAGFAGLAFLSAVFESLPDAKPLATDRVARSAGLAVMAVLIGTAGIAATATLLVDALPSVMAGSNWSIANRVLTHAAVVLAAGGVAIILWRADRHDTLFLWLALALTAFACANVLALAGGGRYSVGWIAGRMSWLIASSVLFLHFMAQFARQQRALAGAQMDLRRRMEDRTAALYESEARLRRTIEAAPFPLMLHAIDGEVIAVSDGWVALSGYARDELRTRLEWTSHAYPDDATAVDRFIAQQFTAERATAPGERTIRCKDGGLRVWEFTNVPIGELRDRRALQLSAALDVTKRKQDEARQRLLAREVDHRAKNMLTVLQVMLRQTRADTVKDYARAVQGRIAALAHAHTLLAQNRWQGADLKRLIEEELAPYRKAERVRLDGPTLALVADAAQSIAMAVHELATNAAKYGALSVPAGQIAVAWRLHDPGFEIVWQESGGPAVVQPSRSGLGTSVVQRAIRDQLGGSVRFDWQATGLRCVLVVPAEQIGRDGAEDDAKRTAGAP
jgi:PAS domain S-box-containing protein